MRVFGVKDLTELSGVSVRTLHYYDSIGLLKPASRTEAGYRFYGEHELLRLQQILFFRELDFPLKEITELLEEPGFNMVEALEDHKLALQSRKNRINKLLRTIDSTINNLKKGDIMKNPDSLYDGLPKEMGTTYRKEAMEKYGKEAIEHSEKELMKLGKDGFDSLKSEFDDLNLELFNNRNEAPDSDHVQKLIARHYVLIRKFWGTSESENNQSDSYAGLGDLYLSDERFTMINDTPQPEYAEFLAKAMRLFANTL